ncbi:MAG TPA: metal-dependent hydrolase [Noviherbaspirillum sp.]
MDNLSHSLVGLAVGELLHRSLAQETDADRQRTRRRLLLFCGWAASNFPDLDLVLTPLLPAPLGYLLHHRGHTHTLLYAIPQALLLLGMLWLWPSARRLMTESPCARRSVIAAVSCGLLLHMMMDFLNSYGIHPFHPFDSRWLFGDMVFIVEPFFWIAFGVPMVMTVRNLAIRALLLAALAGTQVWFGLQGYLPWGSLAVLGAVALATGMLQYRSGAHGRQALILALGMSGVFVFVQGFASGQAKTLAAATLQGMNPENRFLDAAMTSFPTNPLCWNFVSIENNEQAGTYTLRRGVAAIAPAILPVKACPVRFSSPLVQDSENPAIALVWTEQGSLARLRTLRNENCFFEAWLRFARMPSLGEREASDARFAWRSDENFTTLRFEEFAGRECLHFIPGWGFPRSDILMGGKSGAGD